MPMIDLTLPAGALTDEAKATLVDQLSATLIEMEGAPDNEYVRAVTWCFVDERSAQAFNVGGAPSGKPIYRVGLTVPEGAPGVHGPLAAANRDALVRRVTSLVLAAEGSPDTQAEARRVWVQINELDEGFWGGFGETVQLEDIVTYAGITPARGATERGERFRQAFDDERAAAPV